MAYSLSRLRRAARRRAVMARLALQGARPAHGRPHGLPGELVVSLTSFSARFDTLPYTLRSLLSQTVAPDRVVLWLGEKDAALTTDRMEALRAAGLSIETTEDLRSYTKIVPTLERWPDAFVVTADDDVYYEPRWLEDLVARWSGATTEIVFHRGHTVRHAADGTLLPYTRWDYERISAELSPLSFPTGVGGVLYPPGSLDPQVTDKDTFRALCPRADDVWLYWMGRRAGSLYRHTGRTDDLLHWPGSQTESLFRGNVDEGGNDAQIAALVAHLGRPQPRVAAPIRGATP